MEPSQENQNTTLLSAGEVVAVDPIPLGLSGKPCLQERGLHPLLQQRGQGGILNIFEESKYSGELSKKEYLTMKRLAK